MGDLAGNLGEVIAKGSNNAATMAPETSCFDVWSHTADGLSERMAQDALDPVGATQRDIAALGEAGGNFIDQFSDGTVASTSVDGWIDSAIAQQDALRDQGAALLSGEMTMPDGTTKELSALERVGLGFSMLTGLEQMISTMLSVIPFPAFPALRVTDMDIGFPHGHMHPPNFNPPVVPSPIPFPSTGPIIPIPFLSGANTVTINGMPAARCGDMGLGIWCGGYFPMYEVFLGSSSVWIEGARAGRVLCDITKHCIFSTPRPSDFPTYTFLGTTVSASPNVMIGGVPMPSLAGMAMGAAFGAMFRRMGQLIRRAQGTKLGQRLAQRVQERAARMMGQRLSDKARDRIHRALCFLLGHPVDAATGKVLAFGHDINWAGPARLRFERVWASSSAYDGPLGRGWTHSYDMALGLDGRAAVVWLSDGRAVPMAAPTEESPAESPADGVTLALTPEGPVMTDAAGRAHLFGPPGPGGLRPLLRITEADGAETRLSYSAAGHLARIAVTGGLALEVETDARGRITALRGPDPESGEPLILRSFAYDAAGDLVEVRDAYGQPTTYAYRNHMLVRETDRNGYAYRFEYDRYDITGRCLRTWGDGPALDLRFEYEPFAGRTTVSNGQGKRVYRHDAQGLVTELVDARGGVTRYAYDAANRLVAERAPDGSETRFAPDGALQIHIKGALVDTLPPPPVPEPSKDAKDPPGLARDLWGRITEQRAGGLTRRFAWDLENRIVEATHPAGGSERYGYDAGGRLTSITDRAGRVTRYAHFAENTPAAQKRPDGSVIRAEHNAALGLVAAEDANGNRLVFLRDGEDALTEIRGASGQLLRRIERDAAGQPTRVIGPLTRTEHRRDARPGCLIRKRTHRGEDAVLRSETRLFTETRTRDYADDAVRVSTRLDEAGRMAGFSFAGHDFAWAYDAAGRETALTTPWGDIAYAHEPEGLVLTDPLGGRHLFGRDGVDGRPNGAVDETRHLRQGATRLHRHLHRAGETLYAGEAIFAVGGLRRQERETGQTRRFEYDSLDRLVAVTDRTGTQRFAYDAELTLLDSPEGVMSYGAEQTLTRQGARRFEHDAEGRLVHEADGTGRARRYGYDPRGFLARVEDTLSGLDITYSYDDFGRRVAKRGTDALHRKVDTAYIYAGPRLAAERDNLTGRLRHYIYRPLSQSFESWTPVAFIDHEGEAARLYTVHLGLGAFPVLVLDAKGAPVWRARYTPLGAAEEARDNQIDFDFRLPGQVMDRETGLHHTRFRHHDPRTGRFLTVDPLFPVNAGTRYAYSNAPLDRPDVTGLSRYTCSRGGTGYSEAPGAPTAHRYSYTQHGGARDRRIQLARDRINAGEYDPLLDTIEPREVEHFVETGELPPDVQWHHTNQISADPSMADEVETLAPVRGSEHAAEHNGSYATSPTAGIRGDVTTPDRPIYDGNDPDVRAGQHHGDAYRDTDPMDSGFQQSEDHLPPEDLSDVQNPDGTWKT